MIHQHKHQVERWDSVPTTIDSHNCKNCGKDSKKEKEEGKHLDVRLHIKWTGQFVFQYSTDDWFREIDP